MCGIEVQRDDLHRAAVLRLRRRLRRARWAGRCAATAPSVLNSGVFVPSAISGSRSGNTRRGAPCRARRRRERHLRGELRQRGQARDDLRRAARPAAPRRRSVAVHDRRAACAAPIARRPSATAACRRSRSASGEFGSESVGGTTTSVGSGPAPLVQHLRERREQVPSSAGRNSLRARSAALISGSTPRSARMPVQADVDLVRRRRDVGDDAAP